VSGVSVTGGLFVVR